MNTSLRLILLFNINTMLNILSHESSAASQKGPGKSGCGYFGDTTPCNITIVPLKDVPESCTSYFYDGLMFYEDLSIDILYSSKADALDKIRKSGKNVYVNFMRDGNYPAWGSILDCIGQNGTIAVKEAEAINAYMKDHSGITGLLIKYLDPPKDSKEIVGITQNLKSYIEVVKPAIGMEMALSFFPESFIDYYDNNPFPWIDFPALDPCVDFYFFPFTYYNLNGCNKETKYTGLTPLNGNADYTLEKLAKALTKSKIPKEKIYVAFELKPGLDADSLTVNNYCDCNFPNMCLFPENEKKWCSDTLQTFYEKGKWVQDHARGFFGAWIDLDDPYGCCNCEPYPAFRSIIAGLDSGPAPPKCPLIDRQP